MAAGDLVKLKLSGSTDGRGINVAATATPGTPIHTAHATSLDEIWLWAGNPGPTVRMLTIEFGGVNNADQIKLSIPAESALILMVPGLVLTNSVVVRAFAAVVNELSVHGYVNRID